MLLDWLPTLNPRKDWKAPTTLTDGASAREACRQC